MEQTDSYKRERGSGDWLKEGEGISQRTYMKDPWTETMEWGWTYGSGGQVEGGKIGTTVKA